MAKGATAGEALAELAKEGYKGPAIVRATKWGFAAYRIAEVIHLPKSTRRQKANAIYKDICKHIRDYLRLKNNRGEDYNGGDILRFVQANVVTASCGFGWPRYEINSYEAPGKPKILGCHLDAENKIRVQVRIQKFPRIFAAGAVRLFSRLNCYSASTGWIIAQVIKINKASAADFEVEFVVEGMAAGAYVWGTDYLRFSQISGGVLHIRADAGGMPDDKTTIRMSKSARFRFEMPHRTLDAKAEKIRQNCRGYAHNGYLKQIQRKGIERLKAQKTEYYRQHRQRILAYRHEYYLATGK